MTLLSPVFRLSVRLFWSVIIVLALVLRTVDIRSHAYTHSEKRSGFLLIPSAGTRYPRASDNPGSVIHPRPALAGELYGFLQEATRPNAIMLTSGSNQYLRPEYLSPLPTTLDAKKSPLALLAQTCSNIGADTPSSKPLIPPVEKQKDSGDKPRDKSTPSSEDKSSFKPYDSIKKEEGVDGVVDKSGFRTPTSKSASPAVSVSSASGGTTTGKNTPLSSSADNVLSGGGSKSSSSSDAANAASVSSSIGVSCPSSTSTSSSSSSSSSSHNQHNRISIGCGNMFVEVNHHESGLPKDGGLSSHLPLGTYKTAASQMVPPSAMLGNPLANCTGCTQVVSHGLPVDTGAGAYPPGLGGPKPGSYGSGSLSPYVAYARVKTATGGTTLVPICRDPYCTNCQLSVQSAQLVGATCPSGCTQCTHEKAVSLGASHLSALSFIPGLSAAAAAAAAGGPGSASQLAYSHNLLSSHKPYVCNWIAGDTYCGKRFSTSEELLQHLRTHTNLSASDATSAAGLQLLNPGLSLPSVSQSLACHLHYSTAPSLTTVAGLHRTGTYPTSLSPVGSYSSSRYHPYKPPFPPMAGMPMAPLAPHPSLGPYYSPYAMYGQRIGAAVHP